MSCHGNRIQWVKSREVQTNDTAPTWGHMLPSGSCVSNHHQLQGYCITEIMRRAFLSAFAAGLGGSKYISFEQRQWHTSCFNCKKCSLSLVGRGFLTCKDDVLCPDCGKDFWVNPRSCRSQSESISAILLTRSLLPYLASFSGFSHINQFPLPSVFFADVRWWSCVLY